MNILNARTAVDVKNLLIVVPNPLDHRPRPLIVYGQALSDSIGPIVFSLDELAATLGARSFIADIDCPALGANKPARKRRDGRLLGKLDIHKDIILPAKLAPEIFQKFILLLIPGVTIKYDWLYGPNGQKFLFQNFGNRLVVNQLSGSYEALYALSERRIRRGDFPRRVASAHVIVSKFFRQQLCLRALARSLGAENDDITGFFHENIIAQF